MMLLPFSPPPHIRNRHNQSIRVILILTLIIGRSAFRTLWTGVRRNEAKLQSGLIGANPAIVSLHAQSIFVAIASRVRFLDRLRYDDVLLRGRFPVGSG